MAFKYYPNSVFFPKHRYKNYHLLYTDILSSLNLFDIMELVVGALNAIIIVTDHRQAICFYCK